MVTKFVFSSVIVGLPVMEMENAVGHALHVQVDALPELLAME